MINFEWKCHPEAERWLVDKLENAAEKNHSVRKLQKDLLEKTSTRLFDWLDHIVVHDAPNLRNELEFFGFELECVSTKYRVYRHPGAQFPCVQIQDDPNNLQGIAVSVESIAEFLMVRGINRPIEGSSFSGYRRCLVDVQDNIAFWVVERRGTWVFEPTIEEPHYVQRYLSCLERWMSRARVLENEDQSFEETLLLAQSIVNLVGRNRAAWIVLEAERKYWQSKNRAGQLQKNRQDSLGMGWANHDHHTFRSSRRHFYKLVRLFEILGFHCRERYYVGKDGGWGAQILENPKCKLVVFLDVDLAPEELKFDFAHYPLPELSKLSTIGLWCALHGDSILKAGMHHLEAQFQFDALKSDLSKVNIGMMDPFSSFDYLKQAFTEGERWMVEPERIERLLKMKLISEEHAQKFLNEGAIGSHLENLQRNEGYKGFNKNNVSSIIKKTDPRLI